MPFGFRFVLLDEDGEPCDPAVFVTAAPNWKLTDSFIIGDGKRWRIVDFGEMGEASEFDGCFVVEPLPG